MTIFEVLQSIFPSIHFYRRKTEISKLQYVNNNKKIFIHIKENCVCLNDQPRDRGPTFKNKTTPKFHSDK